MKQRLIAGTINAWRDDEEWHNVTLDVSPRGIYDHQIKALVAPDVVADLSDELPMFGDETFDEVRAHHVLEHMTLEKATIAIGAIYRVLKPGGVFDVEVPDMERIVKAWYEKQHTPDELQQWVFGEQLPKHEPGDSHRYGWTGRKLREVLREAGFRVKGPEETGLAVRYRAVKPA